MTHCKTLPRILPVFLLGNTLDPTTGKGKAQQEAQASRVLRKHGLDTELKFLIRKEEKSKESTFTALMVSSFSLIAQSDSPRSSI